MFSSQCVPKSPEAAIKTLARSRREVPSDAPGTARSVDVRQAGGAFRKKTVLHFLLLVRGRPSRSRGHQFRVKSSVTYCEDARGDLYVEERRVKWRVGQASFFSKLSPSRRRGGAAAATGTRTATGNGHGDGTPAGYRCAN